MKLAASCLLVFCLLIATGCETKAPGKGGILSVNEMKLVLWDMMQADEFAITYVKPAPRLDITRETNRLYSKVFALHKIDSARFFESFDYYRSHPKDYKLLMDSMLVHSNRERDNRFYHNEPAKLKELNPQ